MLLADDIKTNSNTNVSHISLTLKQVFNHVKPYGGSSSEHAFTPDKEYELKYLNESDSLKNLQRSISQNTTNNSQTIHSTSSNSHSKHNLKKLFLNGVHKTSNSIKNNLKTSFDTINPHNGNYDDDAVDCGILNQNGISDDEDDNEVDVNDAFNDDILSQSLTTPITPSNSSNQKSVSKSSLSGNNSKTPTKFNFNSSFDHANGKKLKEQCQQEQSENQTSRKRTTSVTLNGTPNNNHINELYVHNINI